VTFRKSPKNILALALLLISGYAFSDSEYLYNELEDGVEIDGCKGDCSLLPEKVDGKNVIGISDYAFNISVFTGFGWSLTWNYRFNSETDSSYIDESAWLNNIEYSPDLPIAILGQSPEGQDPRFEDRTLYPEQFSSNLHNLSSIKIPQGYQYIGDNFFSSNSLKNVSLNEGLQTIGRDAFASNGIRDIVIPDSVSEISSGAFSENPLSHIIFLGNRPSIGRAAFASRYMSECIYDSRGDLIRGSIDCSAVTERPPILPCVSKAYFTEDLPILVIGLEPQGCEYRDDTIFSSQEGWGPINPPGALTDLILESSLDGYFDAIPSSDYEHPLDESFITDFDKLAAIASQFPISEISNSFILEDIYHPLEDMYRHKIYYCSGKSGWPGDPINGVVPEERNCDSVVWDIDQNNSVDALTDGLLLMRYAFGLRGDSLTENVISSDSLIDKAAVEQNIEQIMHLVDINDDGTFDALTDALILLRYLFGVSGNGLVDEEMLTSNKPSAGSIKAYIESHMIKALSN
jgi:hypothetical protein